MLIVHFRKLTKFGFKLGCRLRLQLLLKKINMTTCPSEMGLLHVCVLSLAFPSFFFSFFFFSMYEQWLYCSCTWYTVQETKCTVHSTNNHLIQKKNILKMGPTALFSHSKIILLWHFWFLVFSKISCIRTDPTYFENLTSDYMFFMFVTHRSNFVIIGYYLLYEA